VNNGYIHLALHSVGALRATNCRRNLHACKNDGGFLHLSIEEKNDWERIFQIKHSSWRLIINYKTTNNIVRQINGDKLQLVNDLFEEIDIIPPFN